MEGNPIPDFGPVKMDRGKLICADEIHQIIEHYVKFPDLYAREVPIGNSRLDGIVIKRKERMIHCYEIKVTKSDYDYDTKFALYSEYCTTLTIACTKDLIKPEEVKDPFGLLYVCTDAVGCLEAKFIKQPKLFRGQETMHDIGWLFTYIRVMDVVLNRYHFRAKDLEKELGYVP